MTQKERTLLLAIRQALLAMVAAIEVYLDISPTTANLRKRYKSEYQEKN